MPLFSTPTQFLALAMVLVAGWFFGLASHSGGSKWRERYAAERDAHAAHRRAAEEQAAADRTRLAELERENARIANAAPVTAATIARPTAQSSSRPAYPAGDRRGWFDWGARPVR
jgi:hypothetical protein